MNKIILLSKILLIWLMLFPCNAIGQTPTSNLEQNQTQDIGGVKYES